ncbi:CBO0543 family protein [Metabacillus litoralis]|uniref:CBO0543 family protein n=1 Tax=Metabacillus litoralis TaxID=152268 RepID=UPI00299E8285|nr:CBO0543 family protein [Metabacillus litoralis]
MDFNYSILINICIWKIIILVWILTIALLFIIPKDKKRLASLAFLFKQVITLLIGLVVVDFNLISYPVRLFSKVNRASFTYELFVYPVICSVFNVFYPHYRCSLYKLGYYLAISTLLTVSEIFLEKYTDLINYLHWSWYWTLNTLFITFMLSR